MQVSSPSWFLLTPQLCPAQNIRLSLNINIMGKYLGAVLCLLALLDSAKTEKLICYSNSPIQSKTIYQYLRGLESGSFVDVAPAHPIVDSNTLYIRTQSWTGFNLINDVKAYVDFSSLRSDETNVLIKSSTNNIYVKNNSVFEYTYSEVCSKFINQNITFLNIPAANIDYFASSDSKDCLPELILVHNHDSEPGLTLLQVDKLKKKGFEAELTTPTFTLLIDSARLSSYRDRKEVNNKQVEKVGVISFSRIIKNLSEKVLNKKLDLFSINGNTLGEKLAVKFGEVEENFYVQSRSRRKSLQKSVNFNLLMQLDPETSRIIMPTRNYKAQTLSINENETYLHVEYDHEESKQHLFVFDHSEGSTAPTQWKINVVDIGNTSKNGQSGVQNPEGSSNPGDKKQITVVGSEIEPGQKVAQGEGAGRNPRSQDKIQNLTPENIFTDSQFINKTLWIVVLVCSVVLSVLLTAVVTAYVMRRRHLNNIKSRIKYNAEMASENESTHEKELPEKK